MRTGEGAYLRLRDGTLMFAYTEYCGGDIGDHGEANIAVIFSHDEGETWGEYSLLLRKEERALNIMSVSLLGLANGEILLFYLKKTLKNGHVLCSPMVRSSFDDGKTWGDERFCGRDMQTTLSSTTTALCSSKAAESSFLPPCPTMPPERATTVLR